MPQPGDTLRLNDRDRTELGRFCQDLVQELENEHKPLFDDISLWWDLYEARPISEQRDFPWPGASNVVVPIIRTWSDALINRFFTRIAAAPKVWVASTQNEAIQPMLAPLLDFLNWAAKGNVFDLVGPLRDWIGEMVPIGTSVMALNWVNRTTLRYVPGQGNRGKPKEVLVSRGPTIEHVPREQLLWQPGANIQDSEIVARQRWMTRSDLIRHAQMADWDPAATEEILARPDEEGVASEETRRDADVRAGFQGANPIPMWDIRECWVDFPLLRAGTLDRVVAPEDASEKRPPVPIVVTLHRPTGRVLRAIAHPYFFSHWPFYDIHFRKRSSRGDSEGVARMGRHLQHGMTTLVNQSIDAITFANSANLATTDRRLKDWTFSPNRMLIVNDLNQLRELNFSKQVVPDINLVNLLHSIGERLFGVTDPALGRETRLGGRPAPATSTLAMLEQLELNVGASSRLIRRRLSQLGEDIVTLFQQYELSELPDQPGAGRIDRALGPRDAEVVRDVILPMDEPISGNIHFDIHAMSEGVSPEVERQKATELGVRLRNYYAGLLELGQVLGSPAGQAPFVREVAMKAMESMTLLMRRTLEAFDFDTPESVIVTQESFQNAEQQQLFGQIAQLLGRGGAGVVPGAPDVAGLGGGAPGAGGGAPGPNGPLGSGL